MRNDRPIIFVPVFVLVLIVENNTGIDLGVTASMMILVTSAEVTYNKCEACW